MAKIAVSLGSAKKRPFFGLHITSEKRLFSHHKILPTPLIATTSTRRLHNYTILRILRYDQLRKLKIDFAIVYTNFTLCAKIYEMVELKLKGDKMKTTKALTFLSTERKICKLF